MRDPLTEVERSLIFVHYVLSNVAVSAVTAICADQHTAYENQKQASTDSNQGAGRPHVGQIVIPVRARIRENFLRWLSRLHWS